MNVLCARCQRPLPAGQLGGNCPVCLFGSALHDDPLEGSEEAMAQEIPPELGEFEILGEIGRGGTSVVYRARQRRLNRIVALKTLHGSALTSRDAYERLQTEAQAVARLDHPNIVPLYEVGRHAGTHFLTLRYFEHGSLAHALKRQRFTPLEAARFVATAARAVHHAHSRGVLHRDLKPSNFLLDEVGAPHIADFGLAKLSDGDSSLTLSTSVLGTPAYMAPEQAAGHAKEAGTPADIYALGAVLFELLTGRPPFLGRSALEVLRLVADTEPPRPSMLVPGLDRDLEAVCLRCLEKDPARRYDSAAALAEELERWLRHEPLSIRPLSTRERAMKWVRRRPAIAALTIGCVLAVVLGLLGVLWQWRRAEASATAARRSAYLAEMNAANRALAAGDWPGIRASLDRTRPPPGGEDLRGWEWRYLWGVSRSDSIRKFGQSGREIGSLALLPDGDTVAVGEREGGFSLWNSHTGERIFELVEPINRIKAAKFPLNRVVTLLATVPGTPWLAYTDCRSETESYVRLWNVTNRTVQRSLALPGVPRNLAVSPDGRLLACSTLQDDRRVYVFETATGTLLQSIAADFADFAEGSPLAFSADSRLLAFEGESGAHVATGLTRVVKARSGDEVFRFPQGQVQVVSLAFSPDGRWLASGGGNDQPLVRIWDLQSGTLAHTLTVNGQQALAFDPQGQRLFTGFDIWEVPTFAKVRTLTGDGSGVSTLCLSGDGQTLLTAGSGFVTEWDLNARPRQRQGKVLELPSVHGTFLPDGRGLLFISTNHRAYEALAPHYDCRLLGELGTNCRSAAVLGGLNLLAVGRMDGQVTLHATSNDQPLDSLPIAGRPVTGFWWLRKHGLLAVYRQKEGWGKGDAIEVWDPKAKRLTWTTETEPGAWRWAYSDQDGISYDIFADGRLIGLDLIRHRRVERKLGQETYTGASFSADGRHLLVTYWGGQQLLEAQSLRPIQTFGTLMGTSHGSAIWPDGSRLLLSNCRIVDPVSGRLLLDLESPFGLGHLPAVSPDGSQVLLVSDFAHAPRISVWRAPSWEEIRREEAETGK
ncbi:MAG: protein kinase [Verrucomicrobiae bacterium]|nr:protein kinase [Verrucomicrobiae bacterium]